MRFIDEYRFGEVRVRLVRDPKVYLPSAATRLIAENLGDVAGRRVLDLGTGSGVLAIVCALKGAEWVVATDISRRALRTAEENLRLNGVRCVELRHGDLYQALKPHERFHVIVSNPPMTPSPRSLPRFTWGGPSGRMVLDRVIEGAWSRLEPGGRLIIPTISLVGIGETWRRLREKGFRVRALDYMTHPFGETLRELRSYIDGLPSADYVYVDGRPWWRMVLFEAVKT